MKETNCRYFQDYFESSTKLILKRNVISYVQFLISISLIDISYLLLYQEQFILIIFKVGYNLALVLFLVLKHKSIRYYWIFRLLLLAKILSVILLFLGTMNYFTIFLLLLEEIEISIKTWQYFLEKLLIKIGFLAFVINQQSLLDILIGITFVIQEIQRTIYIFKFHNKKEFNKVLLNNSSQDPNKAIHNFNKLQLIACFIISKKQKAIIFSDQSFQVTSTIINKEQNIDEIILEKIEFYIVDQQREEKNFQLFQNSLIQKESIQDSIQSSSNNENCSKTNLNSGVNLKNFIINHELKKQNNSEKIQNQYYEFIAKCKWNENIVTLYSGQIFILDDDDEVILKLVDITKQCSFQEKLIKEEYKTTIIQSFSHELRTPLNSLLYFLQYCENDKTFPDEIKQNFMSPAINALRLQSYLINDIIDFCQLQSDNLELDIQCFSIQQIVDEVNNIFKSALQMKNLALYFDLTKNNIPQIGTDYSRFMQILANLIQNSIKYSNQGMILIKIASPNISYVKISIKDEGFGIDQATLQKINKLIQNIEQKKFLSQFDNWQGFGISITMLLLQKLKPEGLESFKIKSYGQSKGTKVTFLIKNYIPTHIFSSLFKESKNRKSSRFAVSSYSCSKNYSMNGSIVQLSDPENLYLYHEYTPQAYFWEILKISQKEFIIIFLNFYEENIVVKGILVLLTVYAQSFLNSKYKPFKSSNLNILDQASTNVCLISFVLAIGLYAAESQNLYQLLIPFWIILAYYNIVFLIEIIYKIFTEYFKNYQQTIDYLIQNLSVQFPIILQYSWAKNFIVRRYQQQSRIKQLTLKLQDYLRSHAKNNLFYKQKFLKNYKVSINSGTENQKLGEIQTNCKDKQQYNEFMIKINLIKKFEEIHPNPGLKENEKKV